MASLYINRLPKRKTGTPSVQLQDHAADRTVLIVLLLLGVAAVTVQRVWLGLSWPLWLDETWTAMIASEPTWSGFFHEAWLDCNPPLYYAFMKVWVGFVGDTNVALRLPSLVFFHLAAAVPLVWKEQSLSRESTWTWSALVLLWNPSVTMTADARSYGLLIFLCMCLLMAFMRVLKTCTPARLLLWSGLGAAAVLTHYFAGFLVAVQGAMLLWKWRWTLAKKSFALAPLGIAASWLLYHLPRLGQYSRPDVLWYDTPSFLDIIHYALFSFSGWDPLLAVLLAFALFVALWRSGWKFGAHELGEQPDWKSAWSIEPTHLAFLSSLLALVVILLMSTVQPSVTERYLVPLMPGMVLGVVMLASQIHRKELALALVVLLYCFLALIPLAHRNYIQGRSFYGYEQLSDFVANARPTDLVFVWDHPAAKILDQRSLEKIGGFFLRRAGLDIKVHALILSESDDPNTAIRAAVTNDRTGVIWLYDALHRSAAAHNPPRLKSAPGWNCLDQRSYSKIRGTLRLSVGRIGCIRAYTGGNS